MADDARIAAQILAAAAQEAANLQREATRESLDFLKEQWFQSQQNLAPWVEAGRSTIPYLANLLGIPGYSLEKNRLQRDPWALNDPYASERPPESRLPPLGAPDTSAGTSAPPAPSPAPAPPSQGPMNIPRNYAGDPFALGMGRNAPPPAAPGAGQPGGMVTLKAPDGSTQAVPAALQAHYLQLGATLA